MFLYLFGSIVCQVTRGVPGQRLMLCGGGSGMENFRNPCFSPSHFCCLYSKQNKSLNWFELNFQKVIIGLTTTNFWSQPNSRWLPTKTPKELGVSQFYSHRAKPWGGSYDSFTTYTPSANTSYRIMWDVTWSFQRLTSTVNTLSLPIIGWI